MLLLGAPVAYASWVSSSSVVPHWAPYADTEEAIAEAQLPWRDLSELAVRVKRISPAEASPPRLVSPDPRAVGHRTSYWVADVAGDKYYSVRATLQHVTPHLYMYVADDAKVDTGKLREAATFFEEKIYQRNREYFGHEKVAGLRGDPHLTILNASIPGLGGYFTSVDDYPRAIQPYSNEEKILYINVDAAPPGSNLFYSILTHEFEHMVHWNTNRVEQSWVKEGAAEVATEAAELGGGSSVRAFEARPDTQLNSWADTKGDVAPHYGAAYLYLSYFLEHYGGYEAAAELLTGSTRGEETFDSFLASRGQVKRFEDVFKDWVVANYLDGSAVRNPLYQYDKVVLNLAPTDRVTATTSWRDRTVQQFGADYLEIGGRWSKARVRFQGVPTTRVIPVGASSGLSFWWSNRGDLVNTRLTRVFDLRDTPAATLKFSAWYNLETGYDYGYVMVSRDSGASWEPLRSTTTTTENPNGNNLGHGFSGKSGGGELAQWTEETVDLTPYVGDHLLVRFEMVTDDAYNAPGFAVDQISIPEVGYESDAEEGDDGWLSEGFVRTDGALGQRFALQLIRFGPEVTVEQVLVNEDGTRELVLDNSDDQMERAVLVVSGLTRHTTEPARYRYSVELTP